jgi:hypothetical protein
LVLLLTTTMNIFFLSLIPKEIAEMSCDQHVVKIQLEITQR